MNEEVTQQEQDQPLFVSKTVIDVNTQSEASMAAMKKRVRNTNRVLYGFTGAIAITMVVDAVRNQSWGKNGVMLLILAILMVFVALSQKNMPKKAMQNWEMSIRQRYGSSALHLTTEFYELSLAQTLEEDEEQFTVAGYSSIFELKETENLFLLRHGRDQYYFISKKGFTTGTAEEFRTFIQKRIGGK